MTVKGEVTLLEARVTLRGNDMGVHDVEVQGAIGNDLPGRMASGSGTARRTGTIKWRKDAVTFKPLSPFDAAAPHAGDLVTVDMWDGWDSTRIFTGRVDTRDGDILDPWSTPIVDYSDDLSKVVRVDPLLASMPGRRDTSDPVTTPSASIARVVWETLAKAGYRHRDRELVAPYTRGDVVVYAPLQGSTWTDWRNGHGANRKAGRATSNLTTGPSWNQYTGAGSGGINLISGYTYYDYDTSTPTTSTGFTLMLYVGPNHSGVVDILLELSQVSNLWVSVSADRTVTVKVGSTKQKTYNNQDFKMNASGVLVVSFDGNGTFFFNALQPTAAGPKFVSTSGGENGSYSGVGVKGSWVSKIELWANPGSEVSHLQIFRAADVPTSQPDPRTAIVNLPLSTIGVPYTRSIRDVEAKTVLDEVSDALCCPWWYDAAGTLHLEYAEYLRSANPVMSLPVTDAKKAPHTEDILMSCRELRVKAKGLTQTRSKPGGQSVTLWQGNGGTLAGDETMTQIVGPADDEDWFEVDRTFTGAKITVVSQDKAQLADVNAQRGSFHMTTMAGNAPGDWNIQYEEIAPWSHKITVGTWGTECSLTIPTQTGYGITDPFKGENTPILRGGAIVKHADSTTLTSSPGGYGPALEHECGIWGIGSVAADVARDAAKYMGNAFALYFRELTILSDTRVDVGRVIDLDASALWGVVIRCLVTDVKHNPVSGETSFTPKPISFRSQSN